MRHWTRICHRRDGQCAFRLVQAVDAPVHLRDGPRDCAARLLVEQRDPVRKEEQMDRFLLAGGQILRALRGIPHLLVRVSTLVNFDARAAGAAIGNCDLDLEWVASIGFGGTGRDREEIRLELLVQSFKQARLTDRNYAVRPRRKNARSLNRHVQGNCLHMGGVLRMRAIAQFPVRQFSRKRDDVARGRLPHTGKFIDKKMQQCAARGTTQIESTDQARCRMDAAGFPSEEEEAVLCGG